MDIKEKTKMVVATINRSDDGKFHYFEEMLGTFNESDIFLFRKNSVSLFHQKRKKSS